MPVSAAHSSAAHSAATSPHAIALRGAIGAAHGTGGSSAYTEQPARVWICSCCSNRVLCNVLDFCFGI